MIQGISRFFLFNKQLIRNFASVKVNSSNFDKEVLNSQIPVLLEFGASWCSACKRLQPVLEKIVEEDYKDRIKLALVDVDIEVKLPKKYKVKYVPTVVAIKEKENVSKFVGVKEYTELKEFLDKLL